MNFKTIILNLFQKSFFRTIILITLAILLIAPFFIFKALTSSLYDEITSNFLDDAQRVAKHIQSRHFDAKSPESLNSDMNRIIDDFRVYKIKFFDKNGMTISSTNLKDVGIKSSNSIFYDKVAKGQIAYQIVKKGNKNTENRIIESDVAEIYVPLMENNKFIGAFELYYDITEKIVSYENLKTRIRNIQTAIILSILLIIMVMLYHASKSDLKRKNAENQLLKAKEYAEHASEAKTQFVANLSHEIRTPLNSIISFAEILYDREEEKDKKEKLKIINSSSKTLLQLINDILDFSKIENEKIEIEKITFDLKDELTNIVNIFDSQIKAKTINLTLNISNNTPTFINSDSLRIKQIVLNLLSNAIKFTPKNGNISLDVKFDEKTSKLEISVKDSGIGISKDNQVKVFEKFSQADNSTTRKFGGTGLGLTISKKLSNLLGGDIFLESEEGVGSRFFLIIPVEISKNIMLDGENSDIKIYSDKHILLVEDNPINQLVFKEVTKIYEFNIDVANDGLEAVEMYKNKKYDLIFMDEQMPNMDGIEAIKEIIKIDKNHTPIVALTANVMDTHRVKFNNLGIMDFLGKPIEKDLLNTILDKYLK